MSQSRAQRRHPQRHKPEVVRRSGPQGWKRWNPPERGQNAGGVVLAGPHPVGEVGARFFTSVADLLVYDGDGHRHISGHLPVSSGANIVNARNKIVREFLEKTNAEWLWFVDADMVFQPDTLDRLLAVADPKERPLVGGLCFALLKGEAQEIVPTIYGFAQAQQLVRYNGFPEDTVVPAVGTGAACLLIHRSVFVGIIEAVWDEEREEHFVARYGHPSGKLGKKMFTPPWPWFEEVRTGDGWGDSRSEDLEFCLRAMECGFPLHIDTSIEIGHVKPFVVDKQMFYEKLPPEESPAPTFVVIPVKGKHHFTDAILDQISAQGGYDKVWIFDNASESDPFTPKAEYENVEVVPAEGKNIYAMWNMGIRNALATSQRCNIAILNNDLELGPDFLKNMADGLRAHPTIAAVSANYDGREFPEKVQAVKGIAAGLEDGTGGLAGFAFMVRGEIFTAGCPMFDEVNFTLWYGDNDFTNNLDRAQAMYGIVKDARCVHIGGGSNTSGDGKGHRLTPELKEIAERDRKNYEEKWAS